jgi:hypothetical protein
LPDDAGHVAIAVMSKQTRATDAEVERAIAQIARYAYDYFVFTAREGAHSAPARERSGARGPRERPSRGVGQSPT